MVLAVDGSASVTYEEFGLIAGGMAAALRDPTVAAGLIGHGELALLSVVGAGQQDVITGWPPIATDTDLRALPMIWTTCRARCVPAPRRSGRRCWRR